MLAVGGQAKQFPYPQDQKFPFLGKQQVMGVKKAVSFQEGIGGWNEGPGSRASVEAVDTLTKLCPCIDVSGLRVFSYATGGIGSSRIAFC